jgi:hypothetical protein
MSSTCPPCDALGETEPENTVYTLQVLCPARRATNFISRLCQSRQPEGYGTGPAYTIRPDDNNPDLDCFMHGDLADMDRKTYRVKRALFPLELRCSHLRYSTTCLEGCYVLEKGQSKPRSRCGRQSECQGHVYQGRVKEDANGNKCFGKRGSRMVCLPEKAPPMRRR